MAIVQKTTYICDLCGQKFSQSGHIAKESVPYSLSDGDFMQGNSRPVMHVDLCESCSMVLRAVVSRHFCKVVKDGKGGVAVTPMFVTELGINGITP